jgi:hypothetical protein
VNFIHHLLQKQDLNYPVLPAKENQILDESLGRDGNQRHSCGFQLKKEK